MVLEDEPSLFFPCCLMASFENRMGERDLLCNRVVGLMCASPFFDLHSLSVSINVVVVFL